MAPPDLIVIRYKEGLLPALPRLLLPKPAHQDVAIRDEAILPDAGSRLLAAAGMGVMYMPIYLDRHDLSGLSPSDVAEAHRKDLELQDGYGVRFLTYWFFQPRGTAFCLIDAPDIETAMRVHKEAHGGVATDVIEVQLSAVEAFLGRVADPLPPIDDRKAELDGAFRSVMFTDIVNSTGMTVRLGDVRAVEMVRAHERDGASGVGEVQRPRGQAYWRRHHGVVRQCCCRRCLRVCDTAGVCGI